MTRLRVIVLLAAALIGGGLVDRLVDRPVPPPTTSDAGRGMPVAAPARALASSWFCAGGTAAPDGLADVTFVVANPGREELTGTVTLVPDQGDSRVVPLTVAGLSRATLHAAEVVQAANVAAVITLDGGGVTVDEAVTGPSGSSVAPCASGASDRWYVPSGSTARDNTMVLALFNPFPEDAIADLSFSTDQGRAVPSDFQGIVVKGGGLAAVNIGDHVRRRDLVSATVQTRSGRLVVARLQLRGGDAKSVALALGAPAAARTWYFTEGYIVDGVTEQFHVYNPSSQEAHVDLDLTLEQGAAEPFELTIPPLETVTVKADSEERIPHGVGHAVTASVVSGPAVVVDRSITSKAPSPHVGATDSLGATRTADRWLLAAGAATDTVDEWVTVQNPGRSALTFSVTVLAAGQPLAVDGLQRVKLPAGHRMSVRLGDHIGREDLSLLVSATGAVVVERGLYAVGGAGVSINPAVPLR